MVTFIEVEFFLRGPIRLVFLVLSLNFNVNLITCQSYL